MEITLDGKTYPRFFLTQAEANEAGHEHFRALGKSKYGFKIYQKGNNPRYATFVLQDREGNPLQLEKRGA